MAGAMTTGWRAEALPGIDEQIRPVDAVAGETLAQRFARFHDLNPQVYRVLRHLALDLVRNGRTRVGIGMLAEVVRWQTATATEGEPWKINNSFRAFYARLLMANEPELAGIFEIRASGADDAD